MGRRKWGGNGAEGRSGGIVEGMYDRKEEMAVELWFRSSRGKGRGAGEEAAAEDEKPALRLASFILLRIFEEVGEGNLLTGNPSTSHQPRRPAVQSFRFNFFPFFSSLFLLRVFFFFLIGRVFLSVCDSDRLTS